MAKGSRLNRWWVEVIGPWMGCAARDARRAGTRRASWVAQTAAERPPQSRQILSREPKRRRAREPKLSAPTSDYSDAQGNVLTLRGSFTAGARREYAETLTGAVGARRHPGGRMAARGGVAIRAPCGALGRSQAPRSSARRSCSRACAWQAPRSGPGCETRCASTAPSGSRTCRRLRAIAGSPSFGQAGRTNH